MISTQTTPGLFFTLEPRRQEPSPVRTDIACFAGPTFRGPIGVVQRVEGWKGFLASYGGLAAEHHTPYAVQSYFQNGGEIAWIYRPDGRHESTLPAQEASVSLVVRELDSSNNWTPESLFVFPFQEYRIQACSPGAWANGAEVILRYERDALANAPQIGIVVIAAGEPIEHLDAISLAPRQDGEDPFVAAVNERSRLIRIVPVEAGPPLISPPPGPRYRSWENQALVLQSGRDPMTGRADYLDAVTKVMEQPEPALIAFPDLYRQVSDTEEYLEVLERAVFEADALHDRQVLIDVAPCPSSGGIRGAASAAAWVENVRNRIHGAERTAVVYHPPLQVRDALGTVTRPLRETPPSGAVAGLISRLDRDTGPYYTPANAALYEVVDVSAAYPDNERTLLHRSGINLLKCAPNKGIVVWGGRTLARIPDSPFFAHRRLVHRLVRAFHRVAEPLMFDVNSPILWQTFARSITGVLLRAYRSGALKGDRPEDAFRVKCDAETNPPESIDLGRIVCEVNVAPAAPMEFITLRVAVSAEGALEVFES
jgi:phage tail sheath protein FI